MQQQQQSFSEAAGLLIRARTTGRALIQQRGTAARSHPGTWELSAGGSVEPPETPLQAAFREAREELGPLPVLIVVNPGVQVLHTMPTKAHIYHVFEAWSENEFRPRIPNPDIVSGWAWTLDPLEYNLMPAVEDELRALDAVRDVPHHWLG